jgi:uncharacterized protein (DUF2147 family)
MPRLAAAALAALLTATAAVADPLEGLWQTEVDDGAFAHVEIAPCGPAFCGVILRTFNADGEYASPNIGRTLVIDMVPAGDGVYEGQVWRPSNDKIYIGDLTLAGDQLRLRGCVAGGLLCSGQDWTRVQ